MPSPCYEHHSPLTPQTDKTKRGVYRNCLKLSTFSVNSS